MNSNRPTQYQTKQSIMTDGASCLQMGGGTQFCLWTQIRQSGRGVQVLVSATQEGGSEILEGIGSATLQAFSPPFIILQNIFWTCYDSLMADATYLQPYIWDQCSNLLPKIYLPTNRETNPPKHILKIFLQFNRRYTFAGQSKYDSLPISTNTQF